MNSPFPGMDPFIEACGLWEDFHTHLIGKISETLADATPENYLVRAGERSYVVLIKGRQETTRPFLPDVGISGLKTRRKGGEKKGSLALANPDIDGESVLMRAFIEEEHREAFVEIFEADGERRLVTSIEVLSPSNKRKGSPGWDLYQHKRQNMFAAGINLVEIDLLRGGQRMPMVDPWPKSPYAVLVARPYRETTCRVWPASFLRRLPPVVVPLAKPDPDIPLDLQAMIESIYRRFRYAQSIDYGKPLKPPLNPDDAAWLQKQLRTRKNPA